MSGAACGPQGNKEIPAKTAEYFTGGPAREIAGKILGLRRACCRVRSSPYGETKHSWAKSTLCTAPFK